MQNRAGFTNLASESIANYGKRSKMRFYQYFTYLNVPVAIVLTAKQPKHVFKYTNDK